MRRLLRVLFCLCAFAGVVVCVFWLRIRFLWNVVPAYTDICFLIDMPFAKPEVTVYEAVYPDISMSGAVGLDGFYIDASHASDGYVCVSAVSDKRVRVIVESDVLEYIYDVSSDGSVCVLPVQMGDGDYSFVIVEHKSGTKYRDAFSLNIPVSVSNVFGPFLCPNVYVDYSPDTLCVLEASRLFAESGSVSDFMFFCQDYVCDILSYDYRVVDDISYLHGMYYTVLDDVVLNRAGVCLDYASILTAMFRSQGVPAKLVFGYVTFDDVSEYHAWVVAYDANAGIWIRFDPTFVDAGADYSYILDDRNYSDCFYY